MEDIYAEYHFIKWPLILGMFLAAIPIIIFSFIAINIYPENLLLGFISTIPPLFFGGVLIKTLRLFYFAFTNQPAIIVTKDLLIDNINRRQFTWSDIQEISYRPNQGKALGGHTAVYMKNSGKVYEISYALIKCKRKKFITDLIDYHKQFSPE
jgi:hypothetical protein